MAQLHVDKAIGSQVTTPSCVLVWSWTHELSVNSGLKRVIYSRSFYCCDFLYHFLLWHSQNYRQPMEASFVMPLPVGHGCSGQKSCLISDGCALDYPNRGIHGLHHKYPRTKGVTNGLHHPIVKPLLLGGGFCAGCHQRFCWFNWTRTTGPGMRWWQLSNRGNPPKIWGKEFTCRPFHWEVFHGFVLFFCRGSFLG